MLPTLDKTSKVKDDDLTNLEEYQNGTDPNNPDSDADGSEDGCYRWHGKKDKGRKRR